MDVEVGDHAPSDKLSLDEVARQFDALALVELAGEGELDLAGQLGILPLLGRLDRIPQTFPLPKFLGSAGGRHHLGINDTALVGKIVMAIETLIVKPGCRAIGGRRERARSVGPADDLCGEMIDRHGGVHTLESERRHDA
jgi:hypothetical protein